MSELLEIKRLIDQQGTAWEEYKKTNDAIIQAKAEGKAVGDLETKLATLGAKIDELSELKAQFEEVMVKLNRPGGNKGDDDFNEETKSFNIARRAFSTKNVDRDLGVDDYKNYKSAFFNWVRKGNIDSLNDAERKAMLAGDDSNGGYMLPASTMGRIVAKVFELSPIRQIAYVQPLSTAALEGMYDNDEVSCGYVNETAARPNTNTPAVGKYRIEAFEIYANPKVSQTLIDDAAVDVETWLVNKISNKFARFEGSEFINGTGVGHIRGFTQYTLTATGDATRAWGQIEKIKTGNNGDFASSNPGDKLFDLIGAFKTAYLNRAQWVTTREVVTKIRKFKESTTNAYMWQPGLAKGTPDTLLGYGITNAQDIPAIATGSASLWLGDWQEGYTIVDRQGMRTLRDNLTDKPNVQFYTTKRTGGGVLNFEAIKCITFEA